MDVSKPSIHWRQNFVISQNWLPHMDGHWFWYCLQHYRKKRIKCRATCGWDWLFLDQSPFFSCWVHHRAGDISVFCSLVVHFWLHLGLNIGDSLTHWWSLLSLFFQLFVIIFPHCNSATWRGLFNGLCGYPSSLCFQAPKSGGSFPVDRSPRHQSGAPSPWGPGVRIGQQICYDMFYESTKKAGGLC
jgi:hypothetical protein